MESLALVVSLILGSMLISALSAPMLAASPRGGVRVLAGILAIWATVTGSSMLVAMDAMGARAFGLLSMVGGVAALVRLRRRAAA